MNIVHYTESRFPANTLDFEGIAYWSGFPYRYSRTDPEQCVFVCLGGEVKLHRVGEDLDGNPVPYVLVRQQVLGALRYMRTATGEFQLSFLSVRPDHERKGIARQLVSKFCEHMRRETLSPMLVRSRPGARAPGAFTQFLDKLFTEKGITWEQTRFVETKDAEGEVHNTLARIHRTAHTLSVCTSCY